MHRFSVLKEEKGYQLKSYKYSQLSNFLKQCDVISAKLILCLVSMNLTKKCKVKLCKVANNKLLIRFQFIFAYFIIIIIIIKNKRDINSIRFIFIFSVCFLGKLCGQNFML